MASSAATAAGDRSRPGAGGWADSPVPGGSPRRQQSVAAIQRLLRAISASVTSTSAALASASSGIPASPGAPRATRLTGVRRGGGRGPLAARRRARRPALRRRCRGGGRDRGSARRPCARRGAGRRCSRKKSVIGRKIPETDPARRPARPCAESRRAGAARAPGTPRARRQCSAGAGGGGSGPPPMLASRPVMPCSFSASGAGDQLVGVAGAPAARLQKRRQVLNRGWPPATGIALGQVGVGGGAVEVDQVVDLVLA